MSMPPFRVFLTHMAGDGPFISTWVQEKDEDVTEINNLLISFSKVFESGFGNVKELLAKQPVCAKYKGRWYRGVVLSSNVQHSSAEIYMIDYGYTNEISLADIRSVVALAGTPLESTPPLAKKFVLAGVISASHDWNKETMASICKNFCLQPMIATVSCVNQFTKFAYFTLPDSSNNITSLLVSFNYGVPISINEQVTLAMRYYAPKMSPTESTLETNIQPQAELTPQFPSVTPGELQFRKVNIFAVGGEYEIFVSSVEEGPYCFAAQLHSREQHLNSLMTQLNMQELQPLTDMPLPGTGCAAKLLTDESVCRAIIMQTNSDDTCKVLYIDYGIKELALPYRNLFQLPLKFQLFSPLATDFTLRGIKDLPHFPKLKQWFVELVCDKILTMVVAPQEGPNKLRQQCDLFVNNKNVLEMLKEKLNEEGCKYARQMVEENTQHQAYVTFVDDAGVLPWTFCVQLDENNENLKAIMQKVGAHCQSVAATEPGLPGDAIFAMYYDGLWYRGKFIKYIGSKALVEFVDFGNSDEIELHNLRPALPELVSELPAQAIVCRLQSADTIDTVASKFTELIENKVLNLQVIKNLVSGEALVRLFDSSTCPVTDLARELFLMSMQDNAAISQALSTQSLLSSDEVAVADGTGPRSQWESDPKMRSKSPEMEANAAIIRSVSKMDERWNEKKPLAGLGSDKMEEHSKWEHDKYGRDEDDDDKRQSDNSSWNQKTSNDIRQREEHKMRPQTRIEDRGKKSWNSTGDRNRDSRSDDNNDSRFATRNRDNRSDDNNGSRYSARNRDNRSDDNNDGRFAARNRDNRSDDNNGSRYSARNRDNRSDDNNDGRFAARNRDNRSDDNNDGRYSAKGQYRSQDRNNTQHNDNWEDKISDRGDRRTEKLQSADWEDTTDFRRHEASQPARSSISRGRDNNLGSKNSNCETAKSDFNQEAENWEENAPPPSPPKLYFKPQSLSPNKDKLAVVATFMTSPSDFYIQPESSMDELQSLMDKIVQMCEAGGSAADVPSGYLDPGAACLAKYTADDLWYRAQVLSVSEDKVKVKLVDYGNVLEVDVAGQVKYASAELVELPVQGIYCRLRGATPSVGEVWGQQELLDFTAAVEDRTLKLNVVGIEGLKLMQYSVVLYDEQECLNNKFGASSDSLLPCNELLKCELSQGSEHNAFFSWFITPDNFHVILEDNIKEREFMYGEFAAMECPPLTQVEPGTLVLATKDNAYFRAKTIATRDTKIRVTNLDVGNVQICESSKVLMMPESLKQTPAFAVQCSMFGIVPKNGQWTLNDPEVNLLLKSIPKFVMKVQCHNDQGKTLVTLQAGEVDVAQTLVDKGIADFIKQQEEKLYPGLCCTVFVCYMESLDKIYVHDANRQEEFEEMQEKLQVAELCDAPNPASNIVAARKFDDEIWFRAVQLENTNELMFIDYGNQEKASKMAALPEEFSSFKNFATECCLAVRPLNGALTFSQEAIEKFESLAFDDQVQLTAKVFAKHEGRLLVDFLVDNTTSLIESLGEEKLVEPMMTEAYVTVVESTTEFYIQQVKDESMINEVEERLATEQFDDLQKVEVGMKVLARFTDDGALYRAEVTGESEDGGYRVHFMDYGNGSVSTDFKQLPPDLESLPALCHQCSLASISTSDEEKSKFIQLVNDGTVKFQILELDCQQTPSQVIVLRDGKDILCTEEVTAVEVREVKEVPVILNSVPISDQVTDTCNSRDNQIDCETKIVVSPVIGEKESKTGIYISHYVSSNLFWYQKVEDESKIYQLQEQLALLEDQFVDSAEIDCTYAAQFTEDNTWYRGTVLSLDPKIVFFMDYGNMGVATEFKVLPEDLKMLPAYAHHCALKFSPQDDVVEKKLQEILSDECTVFHVDEDDILYKDGQDVLELVGYHLEDVVISNYTSPNDFFVQPVSELEKLEVMQAQLEEGENLTEITEGMKCAAKFVDDEGWYRCIITSKQEEKINTIFYDYGNSSVATEFKSMSKEIIETKPFAQQCHLKLKDNLSEQDENKLNILLGDIEGPVFQVYLNESSETNSLGVTLLKDKIDILMLVNLNSDNVSEEKIEASDESELQDDVASKLENQFLKEQFEPDCPDKCEVDSADENQEVEELKEASDDSEIKEKERTTEQHQLQVVKEIDEDPESKDLGEMPLAVTPESLELVEPETLVHLTKAAVDLQMYKDSVIDEVERVMSQMFTSNSESDVEKRGSTSNESPSTSRIKATTTEVTTPMTAEIEDVVRQMFASISDVEIEKGESASDEIKTIPDVPATTEVSKADLKEDSGTDKNVEILSKDELCQDEEKTGNDSKQANCDEVPQDAVAISEAVAGNDKVETTSEFTDTVVTDNSQAFQSVISSDDENTEEMKLCYEEAEGGNETEDKMSNEDSEMLADVDPETSLYVSLTSTLELDTEEIEEETMYQSAIDSNQTNASPPATTTQTKGEDKSNISPSLDSANLLAGNSQVCTSTPLATEDRKSPNIDVSPLNGNATGANIKTTPVGFPKQVEPVDNCEETDQSSPIDASGDKPTAT